MKMVKGCREEDNYFLEVENKEAHYQKIFSCLENNSISMLI
jgi:hypothetical protein